jgi:hypothetical protein
LRTPLRWLTATLAPSASRARAVVVGVDVRLERAHELEAQLGEQRAVARGELEHRVDQHGFLRLRVAQQVGVRRGLRVEELAEDQHGDPVAARRRETRNFSSPDGPRYLPLPRRA